MSDAVSPSVEAEIAALRRVQLRIRSLPAKDLPSVISSLLPRLFPILCDVKQRPVALELLSEVLKLLKLHQIRLSPSVFVSSLAPKYAPFGVNLALATLTSVVGYGGLETWSVKDCVSLLRHVVAYERQNGSRGAFQTSQIGALLSWLLIQDAKCLDALLWCVVNAMKTMKVGEECDIQTGETEESEESWSEEEIKSVLEMFGDFLLDFLLFQGNGAIRPSTSVGSIQRGLSALRIDRLSAQSKVFEAAVGGISGVKTRFLTALVNTPALYDWPITRLAAVIAQCDMDGTVAQVGTQLLNRVRGDPLSEASLEVVLTTQKKILFDEVESSDNLEDTTALQVRRQSTRLRGGILRWSLDTVDIVCSFLWLVMSPLFFTSENKLQNELLAMKDMPLQAETIRSFTHRSVARSTVVVGMVSHLVSVLEAVSTELLGLLSLRGYASLVELFCKVAELEFKLEDGGEDRLMTSLLRCLRRYLASEESNRRLELSVWDKKLLTAIQLVLTRLTSNRNRVDAVATDGTTKSVETTTTAMRLRDELFAVTERLILTKSENIEHNSEMATNRANILTTLLLVAEQDDLSLSSTLFRLLDRLSESSSLNGVDSIAFQNRLSSLTVSPKPACRLLALQWRKKLQGWTTSTFNAFIGGCADEGDAVRSFAVQSIGTLLSEWSEGSPECSAVEWTNRWQAIAGCALSNLTHPKAWKWVNGLLFTATQQLHAVLRKNSHPEYSSETNLQTSCLVVDDSLRIALHSLVGDELVDDMISTMETLSQSLASLIETLPVSLDESCSACETPSPAVLARVRGLFSRSTEETLVSAIFDSNRAGLPWLSWLSPLEVASASLALLISLHGGNLNNSLYFKLNTMSQRPQKLFRAALAILSASSSGSDPLKKVLDTISSTKTTLHLVRAGNWEMATTCATLYRCTSAILATNKNNQPELWTGLDEFVSDSIVFIAGTEWVSSIPPQYLVGLGALFSEITLFLRTILNISPQLFSRSNEVAINGLQSFANVLEVGDESVFASLRSKVQGAAVGGLFFTVAACAISTNTSSVQETLNTLTEDTIMRLMSISVSASHAASSTLLDLCCYHVDPWSIVEGEISIGWKCLHRVLTVAERWNTKEWSTESKRSTADLLCVPISTVTLILQRLLNAAEKKQSIKMTWTDIMRTCSVLLAALRWPDVRLRDITASGLYLLYLVVDNLNEANSLVGGPLGRLTPPQYIAATIATTLTRQRRSAQPAGFDPSGRGNRTNPDGSTGTPPTTENNMAARAELANLFATLGENNDDLAHFASILSATTPGVTISRNENDGSTADDGFGAYGVAMTAARRVGDIPLTMAALGFTRSSAADISSAKEGLAVAWEGASDDSLFVSGERSLDIIIATLYAPPQFKISQEAVISLVPSLFVASHNASPSAANVLSASWKAVVSASGQTEATLLHNNFASILNGVLNALRSPAWRDRQAACLALSKLLSIAQRGDRDSTKEENSEPSTPTGTDNSLKSSIGQPQWAAAAEASLLGNAVKELSAVLLTALEALDDLRDPVRAAATVAMRNMCTALLVLADPARCGLHTSSEALALTLPGLFQAVNRTGSCPAARRWALSTLSSLTSVAVGKVGSSVSRLNEANRGAVGGAFLARAATAMQAAEQAVAQQVAAQGGQDMTAVLEAAMAAATAATATAGDEQNISPGNQGLDENSITNVLASAASASATLGTTPSDTARGVALAPWLEALVSVFLDALSDDEASLASAQHTLSVVAASYLTTNEGFSGNRDVSSGVGSGGAQAALLVYSSPLTGLIFDTLAVLPAPMVSRLAALTARRTLSGGGLASKLAAAAALTAIAQKRGGDLLSCTTDNVVTRGEMQSVDGDGEAFGTSLLANTERTIAMSGEKVAWRAAHSLASTLSSRPRLDATLRRAWLSALSSLLRLLPVKATLDVIRSLLARVTLEAVISSNDVTAVTSSTDPSSHFQDVDESSMMSDETLSSSTTTSWGGWAGTALVDAEADAATGMMITELLRRCADRLPPFTAADNDAAVLAAVDSAMAAADPDAACACAPMWPALFSVCFIQSSHATPDTAKVWEEAMEVALSTSGIALRSAAAVKSLPLLSPMLALMLTHGSWERRRQACDVITRLMRCGASISSLAPYLALPTTALLLTLPGPVFTGQSQCLETLSVIFQGTYGSVPSSGGSSFDVAVRDFISDTKQTELPVLALCSPTGIPTSISLDTLHFRPEKNNLTPYRRWKLCVCRWAIAQIHRRRALSTVFTSAPIGLEDAHISLAELPWTICGRGLSALLAHESRRGESDYRVRAASVLASLRWSVLLESAPTEDLVSILDDCIVSLSTAAPPVVNATLAELSLSSEDSSPVSTPIHTTKRPSASTTTTNPFVSSRGRNAFLFGSRYGGEANTKTPRHDAPHHVVSSNFTPSTNAPSISQREESFPPALTMHLLTTLSNLWEITTTNNINMRTECQKILSFLLDGWLPALGSLPWSIQSALITLLGVIGQRQKLSSTELLGLVASLHLCTQFRNPFVSGALPPNHPARDCLNDAVQVISRLPSVLSRSLHSRVTSAAISAADKISRGVNRDVLQKLGLLAFLSETP